MGRAESPANLDPSFCESASPPTLDAPGLATRPLAARPCMTRNRFTAPLPCRGHHHLATKGKVGEVWMHSHRAHRRQSLPLHPPMAREPSSNYHLAVVRNIRSLEVVADRSISPSPPSPVSCPLSTMLRFRSRAAPRPCLRGSPEITGDNMPYHLWPLRRTPALVRSVQPCNPPSPMRCMPYLGHGAREL